MNSSLSYLSNRINKIQSSETDILQQWRNYPLVLPEELLLYLQGHETEESNSQPSIVLEIDFNIILSLRKGF